MTTDASNDTQRAPTRVVINGIPLWHWDYPTAPFDDARAAARWAWSRVQTVTSLFCTFYCDRSICGVGELSPGRPVETGADALRQDEGDDALGANETQWKEAQQDLHKSLSFLSEAHAHGKECPACEMIRALTWFPILVKHSPVPPIATVKLNAVDCYPEIAFVGGVQSRSFPCCRFDTLVGDGHEHEIREEIGIDALLRLPIDDLPAMPPWEVSGLRDAIVSGQRMAMTLKKMVDGDHAGDQQDSEADEAAEKIITANLPAAVCSAVGLRDLIVLRHFYPDSIDEKEARALHNDLVAQFEFSVRDPAFDNIRSVYEKPDFDETSEMPPVAMLFALLLMHHPDVKDAPGLGESAMQVAMKGALQKCQEDAPEAIKKLLSRIIEVQLFDCRIPTPKDAEDYQDPRRFLQLLRSYWGLCRSLLLERVDAPIGYNPHPLTPLIINVQERINVCFDNFEGNEHAREARDTISTMLELLLSGDPDDLSVVPEWTHSQIQQVDTFIEQERLRLGSKSFPLTREEQMCLDVGEKQIDAYHEQVQTAWKKMLANVDRQAATRQAHQKPATQAPAKRVGFSTPPGATWNSVSIRFSNHSQSVYIKVIDQAGTYNYTQMNMVDRRNGEPNKQWELLESFATGRGSLTWDHPDADRRNQKRKELLAKQLQVFFGIKEEPFRMTDDRKGWQAEFRISIDE